MNVPSWYETLLLALASFRIWKLIADDAILDQPRDWLLKTLREEWGKKFELLIVCPWCLGTYVGLAWWGCWQFWPHTTLALAAPASIWAIVGLVGSNLVD